MNSGTRDATHTTDSPTIPTPPLGFGTYGLNDDLAVRATSTALEVGYRHIDTARMYKNEAEVGKAIQESGIDRRQLFLTTKIWHTNLRRPDFLRETDESLKQLRVDFVDLLLIHWPNANVPLEETLDALQHVRDAGKTKLVGVSNFTPTLLRRTLEIIPDLACNQVEYHPFLSQDAVLKVVRDAGMFLTAYSPLGQAKMLGKWTLKRIAKRHNKSVAQIMLRWHLQQDRVVPIPRSGNPDHIRSNFDVFDFSLSDAEMKTISGLNANKRLVNPGWVTWER